MKKTVLSFLIICFITSLLTGCDNANDSIIQYIEQHLQTNTEVSYSSPIIAVDSEHTFTYTLEENAAKTLTDNQHSIDEVFSVYTDTSLQQQLKVFVQESDNEITIRPQYATVVNTEDSLVDLQVENDGFNWGLFPYYYLVQYFDLETGLLLDKPLVTIFTIEHELPTSSFTLQQEKDAGISLTWDAIENATSYTVAKITYHNGQDCEVIALYTTDEPKWSISKEKLPEVQELLLKEYVLSKDQQYQSEETIWPNDPVGRNDITMLGVIATNEDGTSSLSQLSTTLPNAAETVSQRASFAEGESLLATYESISDLPTSIPVTTNDGETRIAPITYISSEIKVNDTSLVIPYQIDNSILTGEFTVTSYNPSTYLDDLSTVNSTERASFEKYRYQAHRPTTYDVVQGEETENNEDTIYANSDIEYYLAVNMINGANSIDLSAYGEPSDFMNIYRLVEQTRCQNPMVLVYKSCQYDPSTNSLYIEYLYDNETRQNLQQQIRAKAKAIIPTIITEEMNTAEKIYAINDYLCENTVYDEAAATNTTVTHSSTAAAVLLDGSGICEGYASSFMLLCQEVGIDCVMITGYASDNNEVRHAWNRVNIDDEWYLVDVTWNDTPDAPNGYLLLADDIANNLYNSDEYFLAENSENMYTAKGESIYEYYRYHNKFFSVDQAINVFVEQLENQNQYTLKVPEGTSEADIQNIANEVNQRTGKGFSIHWANGIITITLT